MVSGDIRDQDVNEQIQEIIAGLNGRPVLVTKRHGMADWDCHWNGRILGLGPAAYDHFMHQARAYGCSTAPAKPYQLN